MTRLNAARHREIVTVFANIAITLWVMGHWLMVCHDVEDAEETEQAKDSKEAKER